MIIVPALFWTFTAYDFSSEVITHLAIGTSLVISISSLTAHNKCGGVVRWKVLPVLMFKRVFGTFLIFTGGPLLLSGLGVL